MSISENNPISNADENWLINTVTDCTLKGFRCTPVYRNGKTKPFAAGQTYIDPDDCKGAVAVGLVLDDGILVDYDGNKAKSDGKKIMSLDELADALGIPRIKLNTAKVQTNSNGDSLHFIFYDENARDHDRKQSCDNHWPYIDLKTGNQLMHIKPHKILVNGELPSLDDIPSAPSQLSAIFRKTHGHLTENSNDEPQGILDFMAHSKRAIGVLREVLSHVAPDCSYSVWCEVLMGIKSELGDTEEGLELADQWSKGELTGSDTPAQYEGRESVYEKFNSFDSKGGITFASVYKLAKDNGADLATLDQGHSPLVSTNPLLQVKIVELAALPPADYIVARKIKAKELGIGALELDSLVNTIKKARPSNDNDMQGEAFTLPDIEPWPEPVNGAEILQAIYDELQRFLHLDHDNLVAMTLWVAHTHCFKLHTYTPRLMITAVAKGCGKTLALNLTSHLCPRRLSTAFMTLPTFFRVITKYAPTLSIDETDTFGDHPDFWSAINTGFQSGSFVLRCIGDNQDLRKFVTHAPVALAGINIESKAPDTIADRSIIINMERATPEEARNLTKFIEREHKAGLETLGRKVARFIQDSQELINKYPEIPEWLTNRAEDKWVTPLAIAKAAGGVWPEWALAASRHDSDLELSAKTRSLQLLESIKAVLPKDAKVISTISLITRLADENHDNDLWRTYNFKNPIDKHITDRQLSNLLADYKIKPSRVRVKELNGKEIQKRGYKVTDFERVFSRYL